MKRFLTLGVLCAIAIHSLAQVCMTIDATRRGPHIGPYHNGLFFEEINHAGDGGLYAELISNRSFEDGMANWSPYNGASIRLKTKGLLNDSQRNALSITVLGASKSNMKGVANSGFWGMNIVKDSTYNLSLWVKGDVAYSGKLIAQLRSNDGKTILGTGVLQGTVSNTSWSKLNVAITPTKSDERGQLLLLTGTNGRLDIDVVSMFPYTWNNRPNGLRSDLAQLLADMHPSFLRFPGGCYVEGEGSYGNAFQWKKTIGPIEARPGHYNKNWGYWSSDGLGFDEYLQLCEDLGAAPMFVVNIGLGHGFSLSHDSTMILVQDVLDAIEYANGDATTYWGAKRIANGHSEPYGLKFVEIGNENYSPGEKSEYAERYILFYEAIKAKYPDIVTIGNVEAWGTDNPSWGNSHPVEIVDEHYYRHFQWMRNNYGKYDNYPRFPIVYNGEYAANGGGYGKYGNMNSALGEAIYMLGMERNSDVCQMASFAPIFTHEKDPRWPYDMIHFNASDYFVTPSYYVQKMMNLNLGQQNLLWTETGNALAQASGDVKVGIGSWGTQVAFDDISVNGSDGSLMFSDHFDGGLGAWIVNDGNWNVSDGTFVQSSSSENCTAVMDMSLHGNYIYKVRAMKTGGNEGFLILFNFKDSKNYAWWNIGGWNNRKHGVEICVNGTKSTVVERQGRIESNKWYDIEVRVNGADVTCLLDNEVIHTFTLNTERALYQSVQIDEGNGELILKVVNPHGESQRLNVNVQNMKISSGTVERLSADSGTDENTMERPDVIVPTKEPVAVDNGESVALDIPPYSLNVFRLGAESVGEETRVSYPEYEREDRGMGAYLFAHMNRNGEYTSYALSKYGNNWQDMLGGAEVFDTKANTVTGGMRDAYITRMHDGNFMLAGTDMTSRLGWTSNHIMVLMLSPDLVHWTKNVKIDLESEENLKALGGITADEMTAAWAPQVIYDRESGNYVMYYSVGFPDRHRIYYSIIDKDLNVLSRPALLFDPGYDVIDADIVWNDVDKHYVMLYKCEKTSGFDRATATHLVPAANETSGVCQWTITPDFHYGENNQAIEAPTQWRKIGSDKWMLAYINYSGNGYGYKICGMDEHGLNVGAPAMINGSVAAQHGSILKISSEEYDYLKLWERVKTLLPDAESYYKACKHDAIADAILKAQNALSNSTTFDENVKEMNAAYDALIKCKDIYMEYIKNMGEAGKAVDMTALLVNPDFRDGAKGWNVSTNFTQANGAVAEYWNTSFDFSQTIENMPKGEYEVSVQSFYRNGSVSDAVSAHVNGTEKSCAVLYANDSEEPIMSIYDESVTQYGLSPYTYPDNVATANEAFNKFGLYTSALRLSHNTTGPITIGIRKMEHVASDWCCFDNFTLKYLGEPSSVNGNIKANVQKHKLYTLDGCEVRNKGMHGKVYIKDGQKIIE